MGVPLTTPGGDAMWLVWWIRWISLHIYAAGSRPRPRGCGKLARVRVAVPAEPANNRNVRPPRSPWN
jgi:hypothetical protein